MNEWPGWKLCIKFCFGHWLNMNWRLEGWLCVSAITLLAFDDWSTPHDYVKVDSLKIYSLQLHLFSYITSIWQDVLSYNSHLKPGIPITQKILLKKQQQREAFVIQVNFSLKCFCSRPLPMLISKKACMQHDGSASDNICICVFEGVRRWANRFCSGASNRKFIWRRRRLDWIGINRRVPTPHIQTHKSRITQEQVYVCSPEMQLSQENVLCSFV